MRPELVKTTGYLISCVSVFLLGAAAWPGAEKAGLVPLVVLGMITSISGMACRWYSYEAERRAKRLAKAALKPADASPAPQAPMYSRSKR